MTRAALLAMAVVSIVAAAPHAQARNATRQAPPSLVASGENPYAGIFRNGGQPLQSPMVRSPLRSAPTVLCGMTVFRGDPTIDARIFAEPKFDGRGSKPTPKARIIEPKVCVENSTIQK